jgi:hypothetical protein
VYWALFAAFFALIAKLAAVIVRAVAYIARIRRTTSVKLVNSETQTDDAAPHTAAPIARAPLTAVLNTAAQQAAVTIQPASSAPQPAADAKRKLVAHIKQHLASRQVKS